MNPFGSLLSRAVAAVDAAVIPFAILFGLVLTSLALCFLVLTRVRGLIDDTEQRRRADQEQARTRLDELRQELQAVTAQWQEIRQHAASPAAQSVPRSGLNLSKRSQALRMSRRGDAPLEIATSLGVPLQEVDLLLKVHRIVIRNL